MINCAAKVESLLSEIVSLTAFSKRNAVCFNKMRTNFICISFSGYHYWTVHFIQYSVTEVSTFLSVSSQCETDVGQVLELCFQALIVASQYSLASLTVLAAFMPKVATDICLHRLDERRSQVSYDFMEKRRGKHSCGLNAHSVRVCVCCVVCVCACCVVCVCVCKVPDVFVFDLINMLVDG